MLAVIQFYFPHEIYNAFPAKSLRFSLYSLWKDSHHRHNNFEVISTRRLQAWQRGNCHFQQNVICHLALGTNADRKKFKMLFLRCSSNTDAKSRTPQVMFREIQYGHKSRIMQTICRDVTDYESVNKGIAINERNREQIMDKGEIGRVTK